MILSHLCLPFQHGGYFTTWLNSLIYLIPHFPIPFLFFGVLFLGLEVLGFLVFGRLTLIAITLNLSLFILLLMF